MFLGEYVSWSKGSTWRARVRDLVLYEARASKTSSASCVIILNIYIYIYIIYRNRLYFFEQNGSNCLGDGSKTQVRAGHPMDIDRMDKLERSLSAVVNRILVARSTRE